VSVERLARHPLYKRVIRLTTKFKAHDETNDARTGDTVLIEESRPLSATKRWRLVSIIQRAGEHGLPGEAVVGEEAAVTEAIHAAAHPGRTRAAEADAESDSASAPAGVAIAEATETAPTAKTTETAETAPSADTVDSATPEDAATDADSGESEADA
jgi:small subunit ribosomal protein S17